jgi:tRNA-2-methylthio-N6-dimethylallyladenosine synthase
MNEADSSMVCRLLEGLGYDRVERPQEADVVFLNTCSVREKPEQKALSRLGTLRDLKERRPGMIIAVGGCMAQRVGEALLKRAPHVDILVGPRRLYRLPMLIESGRTMGFPQVDLTLSAGGGCASGAEDEPLPTWACPSQTAGACPPDFGRASPGVRRPADRRALFLDAVGPSARVESARVSPCTAYVNVMQGCSYFCSFCIVPFVRGTARSRPPQQIIVEVKRLVEEGVKEVTLLGQNILAYGKDMGARWRLADLLEMLNDIVGLERIRFTTGHPRDVDEGLLHAMAGLPKVCEHLHAPIQAGDNRLLRDMKRFYTVEQYLEMVQKARETVKGISITSDIIVGFPGETEEEFEESLRTYEAIGFDQAFMFAYCPRPRTLAAAMDNQVPDEVKRRRLKTLIALQNRITHELNKARVGKSCEVLVEGPSEKDASRPSGRTRDHRLVVLDGPAPSEAEGPSSLIGQIADVEITAGRTWGLEGRVAAEQDKGPQAPDAEA